MLTRTNGLGAIHQFKVGSHYECGGREFRVTRHKVVPTTPWATVIVYGRPA